MFQDGVKKTISPTTRALTRLTSASPRTRLARQTPHEGATSQLATCPEVQTVVGPAASHSAQPASGAGNMTNLWTGFLHFPWHNFRYSLTLFSKFFASFPHGTCALSVSHRIFSFRRNLPPTLSINPKILDSLRARAEAHGSQARTGVSPSQLPFSKGLGPGPRPTTPLYKIGRAHV